MLTVCYTNNLPCSGPIPRVWNTFFQAVSGPKTHWKIAAMA